MNIAQVQRMLDDADLACPGASVLIPLMRGEAGLDVLLEVRALDLAVQPGEVCLPGGKREADESPLDAALRETCEELLVRPSQLEVLGSLGTMEGPGARPLEVYVAELRDYQGGFSPAEVDRTFTVPLDWLASHAPTTYCVSQELHFPADFPWDLIPGGRAYPWQGRPHYVPFYLGSDPIIWGVTARVLERLISVLELRK